MIRKNLATFVWMLLAPLAWVPAISLGASFFNVDEGGNVGIGNTDPQAKLDVSGAMYSRLVTVTDAASTSVDWSEGNVQSLTLSTSNTALTFLNGKAGGQYKLIVNQDSVGGRTITWPSSVIRWDNNQAPTLVSAASSSQVMNFLHNGDKYLGSLAWESNNQVSVCKILIGSPNGYDEIWGATTTGPRELAQSFTVSSPCDTGNIGASYSKVGSPTDDVVVAIYNNNAGVPGSPLTTCNGIASSGLSASPAFSWATSTCSSSISLTPATTYWLVWTRNGGPSDTNKVRVQLTGTSGDGYYFNNANSTWTAETEDFLFEIDSSGN